MRTAGSLPLLLPMLLATAAAQQPRQGALQPDYGHQYGYGHGHEDYEDAEDYEEGEEYDEGEDYDEDEDYSLLWDEEELEPGGEAAANATAEDLELLSRVADFLVHVHQLLADLDMNEVRERADRILADAFGPVDRAAAGAAGANECWRRERLRARADLDRLQEQLEECYRDAPSESGSGPPQSLDALAAEEEEAEAAQLRQEAEILLQLALTILRLSSFPEVVRAAAVAADSPLGGPELVRHAEMLLRRARDRRRAAARCVDLRLEAAYRRADSAEEALAACRARAALAAANRLPDEL